MFIVFYHFVFFLADVFANMINSFYRLLELKLCSQHHEPLFIASGLLVLVFNYLSVKMELVLKNHDSLRLRQL